MVYNVAKHNKSFSGSEYVEQSMVVVAEPVHPESKTVKFIQKSNFMSHGRNEK